MMAMPNPPHDEALLESPMKRIAVVLCLLATAAVSAVTAQQGFKNIKEYLSGYEEVPVGVHERGCASSTPPSATTGPRSTGS